MLLERIKVIHLKLRMAFWMKTFLCLEGHNYNSYALRLRYNDFHWGYVKALSKTCRDAGTV